MRKMCDPEAYLSNKRLLHVAGSDAYEESRTVFNRDVRETPTLVVRPESEHDVCVAMDLAKQRNLQVTVRNGGHSAYGYCVKSGALLLDMRHFDTIETDLAAARVRVGAGVLSGALDNALAALRLAVPLGDCPGVGVAGLALGGGNGFISRKYGLTCDTIAGCRMITADGRVLRVDSSSHPDLLWALRGAGQGNFGVVTSITFDLNPVPATLVAGSIYFPLDASPGVLEDFQRRVMTAPDELSIFLRLNRELRGVLCARVYGICLSEPAVGMAHFAEIERWARPVQAVIRKCSYLEAQQINMASITAGVAFHWKTTMLSAEPDPEFWRTMVDCMHSCPNALSRINVDPLGGAIVRAKTTFSAFAHRDKKYILSVIGIWEDSSQKDLCRAWVARSYRRLLAFCHPHASYTNYVDPEMPREAYFAGHTDRLVALKAQWDPDNRIMGILAEN